ncbi:MAG: hypothetical protein ACYC42_09935, partial [Lysobacter sp.]
MNIATGVETNGEYMSTVGSTTANELDCEDCHLQSLLAPGLPDTYVGHAAAGVGARIANPYMLREVIALNQYDVLCRLCHASTLSNNFEGTGVDIRLGVGTRHGDALAQAIVEDDGTQLRTTAAGGGNQCRACHDTHYSGKVKLFNDGHEGDQAIVSSDCTTVCHYAGDVNDGYLNHGHGKATSTYKYKGGVSDFTAGSDYVTMGMGCSSCHQILDTSDTSGTRKAHVEQPTGGTIQQNYQARYNLSLAVQGTDTGSSFGNPTVGVCYFCHGAYIKHQGDAANTTSGCQDCHDEHAEGSGVGSNYFMIPQTAKPTGTYLAAPAKTRTGAEAVTYDSPRRDPVTGTVYSDSSIDFYRADAAGACDNQECHGPPNGTTGALSALMAGGTGTHGGGVPQAAGSDCAFCHKHNDATGGWRAGSSCSNSASGCHGTDAANVYPDGAPGVFPDRGGKHSAHVLRIAAVNSLSATGTQTCIFCHPGGTHSGDAVTPAELNDGTAGKQFRTMNNLVDL